MHHSLLGRHLHVCARLKTHEHIFRAIYLMAARRRRNYTNRHQSHYVWVLSESTIFSLRPHAPTTTIWRGISGKRTQRMEFICSIDVCNSHLSNLLSILWPSIKRGMNTRWKSKHAHFHDTLPIDQSHLIFIDVLTFRIPWYIVWHSNGTSI